ncbi:MAG: amidohydrolase family protein [Steroidobacteraceae bacterium]
MKKISSCRLPLATLGFACALTGLATFGAPRIAHADAAPFKLFDGHLHPVSDDTQRYPHAAGAGGPPGGGAPGGAPGGGGAGGPPGGGGAGASNGAPQAKTDIDKRVLQWMDEEGVEAIADVQKRGTYGTDNSYTIDAADAHKDRLNAVVILDAQDARSPAQLQEMIQKHGIAGLRLTGAPSADGTFPWLSSPQALKVWEVANKYGIVLDIMITNEDNTQYGVPEIIKLAKAYPNVRLVLDHALFPKVSGAPDYGVNATYAAMAKQKNIYYKFTSINLGNLRAANVPAPDFVRRLVDVYGADHVLWGSDAANTGGTYHDLVAGIVATTTKLNDTEKRKVLHDTGKGVFVRGGKLAK